MIWNYNKNLLAILLISAAAKASLVALGFGKSKLTLSAVAIASIMTVVPGLAFVMGLLFHKIQVIGRSRENAATAVCVALFFVYAGLMRLLIDQGSKQGEPAPDWRARLYGLVVGFSIIFCLFVIVCSITIIEATPAPALS